MYIFLYFRYGYVYRCICLCIYTHMWDVCMCEKKERKIEGEKEMCVCACMCVHTTYFLTQVYTEDKIKIILQQQAGSQRFIYIHCYHQGDEWGRSEVLFTRSTMGVKEEEGCHRDMHKLEGRGIWKVLLRKPWWHNAGEKKGEEAGLLCFRWLFKKEIWKRVSGNGWYLRCLRCCGSWKVFCWHRALSQGQALETKGRDQKKNK